GGAAAAAPGVAHRIYSLVVDAGGVQRQRAGHAPRPGRRHRGEVRGLFESAGGAVRAGIFALVVPVVLPAAAPAAKAGRGVLPERRVATVPALGAGVAV